MAKKLVVCLLLLLAVSTHARTLTDATGTAVDVSDTSRVIALGGDITEIVYALGQRDHLVAVDSSSVYPAAVNDLPHVGYVRRLAAEGVLSLAPSLIIANPDVGPPEVLAQIQQAGVPIFVVPAEDTVAGAKTKINTVADIFGASEQAQAINRNIDLDISEARLYTDAARASTAPKVMFIYARGAGALSVSGTDTAAHAMIELTGAENAITEYEGYKPLTAEAAVTAAPDVLLFMTRGLDSVGGYEGLADLPGLALTPAYQNQRIVALDDLYLLGFGPRVGQAIKDLTLELYPNATLAAR
jgi:iron complex transport system substrate-binding protein